MVTWLLGYPYPYPYPYNSSKYSVMFWYCRVSYYCFLPKIIVMFIMLRKLSTLDVTRLISVSIIKLFNMFLKVRYLIK
jgi:hypothetical protein